MDFPDRQSLFAVARRTIVTTPNLRINPKAIDVPGTDLNIILGAMSVIGEELSTAFIDCIKGLFVETAELEKLDRVAFDRYQITRLPSVPATVTLTISRATFAFGVVTVPAGTRVQNPAGVQFATNVDLVFEATTLSATVAATALVAGLDGNVPAEQLTQFIDAPADSTLRPNNVSTGVPGTRAYVPGAAAGGTEVEEDADFRARILGFFQTVRRGTLGAIEYGALQVPGVAVAKAIETVNECGGEAFPACQVTLIISDRDGGFSATMIQRVRDSLITYRAAGIPVLVTGGVVKEIPVTWHLRYAPGADQARVREQLRAVTVAVAQFLRPQETLLRSALLAGARTVVGAVILDDALPVPQGDIVPPNPYDILRINPQQVTFA